MALRWTRSAERDLRRLHAFLEPVDPSAAARVVRSIIRSVQGLARHPRIGRTLPEFEPREVRRLVSGDDELRYELSADEIHILRIFHVHEDR